MSWRNFLNFLEDHVVKNQDNNLEAIRVDTQSIESSYTLETSSSIDSDSSINPVIEPSSGNIIIIKDVFIVASANMGEIVVDFSGGTENPAAVLYSDRFSRVTFTNLTKRGNEGEGVEIIGGNGSDNFFVLINYIEVEA